MIGSIATSRLIASAMGSGVIACGGVHVYTEGRCSMPQLRSPCSSSAGWFVSALEPVLDGAGAEVCDLSDYANGSARFFRRARGGFELCVRGSLCLRRFAEAFEGGLVWELASAWGHAHSVFTCL